MPGGKPPRSYWDSCVFLAWLNAETGRASVVDALLRTAKAGELEIVTSVLSITEVAFVASEKQTGVLSPAALAAVDSLWEPPAAVKLVEFHRLIAADARDLIRQSTADGHGLKPADAIHLSTAKRAACDEFVTYDPALQKYAGAIGIPVKEPVSDQLALEFGQSNGT